MHPLRNLIEQQNQGVKCGIASCCSANEYVLRAVLRHGARHHALVLIEATANQVNQFGGYTGMKPADFYDYVMQLVDAEGVRRDRVLLGGDHLGPLVWRNEDADTALKKAEELVRDYVLAGFSKIHIDTSMPLGGEKEGFGAEKVASRSARLCRAAEDAWRQRGGEHPVYVIGSEVPIPGGAMQPETVTVTEPASFKHEIHVFKEAYQKAGLDFSNVIAFVVQPGVEFSNDSIHAYGRERAAGLMKAKASVPSLVFEGHSTDYQPRALLREMVEDGVAILKVGPALTFALREGLIALENIARELTPDSAPSFREALTETMLTQPENWQGHYFGDTKQVRYELVYGLSDRCRYYLGLPAVRESIETLIRYFDNVDIPYALLRQYMPLQAAQVWEGKLKKEAICLLYNKVDETLDDYLYATRPIDSTACE